MDDAFARALTDVARRLVRHVEEEPELHAGLRVVAEAALVASGESSRESEPPDEKISGVSTTPVAEPLKELTFGRKPSSRAEIQYPSRATSAPDSPVDALAMLEGHCRLKAEGARWAAACQRRLREGGDFQAEAAPEDRETLDWADRLTDCYYWLDASDGSPAPDLALFDDLGGCFETVAEALAVIQEIQVEPSGQRVLFVKALQLLAEAQSALRAAIHAFKAADDPEQVAVFDWLKSTAARHQVYIKRFMRADDPADPTRWQERLNRIEGVDASHRQTRKGAQRYRQELDSLRALLSRVHEGTGTEADWRAVVEAVDAMVGEGLPPSHVELRQLLLPVIDDLPDRDDLPRGFRLALREVDRFLATRTVPSKSPAVHEPTAEVRQARKLLAGRSVVLIGGSCRREARDALKDELGLKALTWIETKEHQSIASFESAIAHPDVAVVLLAIRWSSHAFGDVKHDCDRHGKPLVRLPGGYNTNQVAAQIVAQCSGKLEID
jgi:hypothetical protein